MLPFTWRKSFLTIRATVGRFVQNLALSRAWLEVTKLLWNREPYTGCLCSCEQLPALCSGSTHWQLSLQSAGIVVRCKELFALEKTSCSERIKPRFFGLLSCLQTRMSSGSPSCLQRCQSLQKIFLRIQRATCERALWLLWDTWPSLLPLFQSQLSQGISTIKRYDNLYSSLQTWAEPHIGLLLYYNFLSKSPAVYCRHITQPVVKRDWIFLIYIY